MAKSLEFAKGRLPYASEVFGTYRPMIGWASKRKNDRLTRDLTESLSPILKEILAKYVTGNRYGGPPDDRHVEEFDLGRLATAAQPRVVPADSGTFLIPELQRIILQRLDGHPVPTDPGEWSGLVNEESVREAYGNSDLGAIGAWHRWSATLWDLPPRPGESETARSHRIFDVMYAVIDRESRLGAALIDLANQGSVEVLSALLFAPTPDPEDVLEQFRALQKRLNDPFLNFDPRDGLTGVSVSPLGIVHYFRQYFFELDTFLGPAVGHVWLTPGTTVELIESSTRRTLIEQTVEIEQVTIQKREIEDRRQEDVSDAVQQENRSDSKLGFSTTVNQSWPTGDATATGSFNLDTTQSEARDTTYKRMREQSEKLSSEIRSSYKSTFKTVTETTDVSSKRYVISNPGTTLQNYELRRKMRRVAVQVQDIGTYLCWETFVDDPACELGLANLVHIAKQPDITPPPYPTDLPTPESKSGIPFDVKVAWAGKDDRVGEPGHAANRPEGILLGHRKITVDVPDGYAFELQPGQVFQLQCLSARGEGQFGSKQYLAKYLGGNDIEVILGWGQNGLRWTHNVDIDLRGTVTLAPTPTLLDHIAKANEAARAKVDQAALAQQAKAAEAAFYAAAQERIELASSIRRRRFEDLREEERTVVYRRLIADLMAAPATARDPNHWYKFASPTQRHAYATVLNAIFDIDRMLYFVAPEWWQPRQRSGLVIGDGTYEFGPDKIVAWNSDSRPDNYLITGKSEPARLGSSLGWLLQLDGDDQRNRFLNASWVRAVIPVRPGKEEAAINWLTKADVEGTEGLGFSYAGTDEEAEEIIDGLADTAEPAQDPPTVGDAIRYLCKKVGEKHVEGRKESLFPARDGIADGDKVWATPIDKVYEHGFYPLERSFRDSPTESPADGKSTNFQIMAQWTEVLPTDQIVPVEVKYDPISGRQIGVTEEPE
jgi:hypothetical protein